MTNQPPGDSQQPNPQGRRGLPYRPAPGTQQQQQQQQQQTITSQQPQPSSSLLSRYPHPTLTTRRSHLSPTFASKLRQLALPLAPLVQLTSGTVHPEFPQTLLNFWLLTDNQLDRLASFYHQRTPCQWTAHYPCPVSWPAGMGIEEKRRRIGRFIGLRGCESPLPSGTTGAGLWANANVNGEKKKETTGKENGGQVDDDEGDAMEIDSDTFSKVMSSPIMANKGNEGGADMSAYISELLRSTLATTPDEDIAETERKIMKAEDELDQIRKNMGWYF